MSKASPHLRLKSGWKIPDESSELGLEDVTCIGLAEFCVQWSGVMKLLCAFGL